MAFNLFGFVGLYQRHVETARHLLRKGAAHAAEHGIADATWLGWRLIGDMQPLSFQFATVAAFTQQWPARVADLPVPERYPADLDVAGYDAALATAATFLSGLRPDAFAGREDVPITVRLNDTIAPTLPAGRWLSDFATTNVAFHLSVGYAVLRTNGVSLGKVDMFPGGF